VNAEPFAILEQGARALTLSLDDQKLQLLLDYLALIQKWNQVYNLTALREPDKMLTHHLLDCLAMLPALARQLEDRTPVGSEGLKLLHSLDTDSHLAGHHRLHAVRAHLLEMNGDREAAVVQYQLAASRTASLPERNYLTTQAARLRELLPAAS